MAFRFRYISKASQQLQGFIHKELNRGVHNGGKQFADASLNVSSHPSVTEVSWCLASLNINSIKIPPLADPRNSRVPPPLPFPARELIEPTEIHKNISQEDHLPTKSLDDPVGPTVLDKQAARLVVIRRKKMKTHKLKKLRKRTRFEVAKRRQRREMKKEKLFHAELIACMKQADIFNPAEYAADKIARATKVELPEVWHGVKYPDYIIKQLIEEKEAKEKEKEADEKRRASMSPYVRDYLKNLPK